jgi:hypothetical protein
LRLSTSAESFSLLDFFSFTVSDLSSFPIGHCISLTASDMFVFSITDYFSFTFPFTDSF